MWNGQQVTVVFPAYNEEDGIARAVEDFGGVEYVDEVIVVDNNSVDRTAELAERAGARVVAESKQGYGHALQSGMREAKDADLVILAEPDGTFTGVDVPKLLVYSDDAELVLGTRTTREFIWQRANMGFALRWGNWAVAKFLQLLFGTPSLSDVGCTMRLIHRDSLDRIQHRFSVGSSHFLPEMVILARLAGMSMVEVPVKYRPRLGTSKITGNYKTAVNVGWRMVALILAYRFRSRGQRSAYSERPPARVTERVGR
jgi:glycosyltransferase involved in cell wall biosynthesis